MGGVDLDIARVFHMNDTVVLRVIILRRCQQLRDNLIITDLQEMIV